MNIVAFVTASFSALLSFLQGGCGTVLAGGGIRLAEFLGMAPDHDLERLILSGFAVVIAAPLALIGGGLALARKRSAGVVLAISAVLCALAYQGGFKDAAIWGICYFVAAVFAYLDTENLKPKQLKIRQTREVRLFQLEPHTSSDTAIRDEEMSPSPRGQTQSKHPLQVDIGAPQYTYEPTTGFETDALVTRAFLFLEDGDFSRAGQYLEQALNQDPENSSAYLGRLMVELKVCSEEELSNCPSPLEDNRNYQRAVRFADEPNRVRLAELARANLERSERQRAEDLEAQYTRAIELKSRARYVSDYTQLTTLFGDLGNYRDSEAQTEQCRRISEEKRRQSNKSIMRFSILTLISALLGGLFIFGKERLTFFSASPPSQEAPVSSIQTVSQAQKAEKTSTKVEPEYPAPERGGYSVHPSASGEAGQSPETIMALGAREQTISIYENPDLHSSIVGSLPSNHVFPIIEAWVDPNAHKRWYRVASENNGRGWIPEDGVRLEGEEEILSDFLEYGEESFNNMRRDAEEDEQRLRRFITDKRLPSHVVAGGHLYLVRSYGYSLMEIRGNKVNLRREPNTRSGIIMQMNEGYPVDADAYWTSADGRETWYYVRTPDSREGWVFGEFIRERPR